ncbi:MAG: CHAT domain-containing protein, partial [Bacteroidota bacterium]
LKEFEDAKTAVFLSISSRKINFQNYVEDELFAQIYIAEKNCSEAVPYSLKAIRGINKRFEKRPTHPDIYSRYLIAAQAYSLCTQYDSAMYYFQHALRFSAEVDTNQSYFKLPTIEEVRYPHNVIPVLIERGKTLKAWYQAEGDLARLKDAYQSYLLATQLIDRLRKGFRSAGSKLLLSEDAIPTYESAIQLAWQLYQTTGEESYRDQIISLMEQNKASLLLERLKESDIKTQLGVPDSVLEKERELRIDIAYYQKLLYQKTENGNEADSSKVSELRQKIFGREESLRQLQDLLARDYPEYHQLKYAESVANLHSIRSQLLQDDEMMIEYFWGDSSLIVLGIGEADLQYHTVPIAEVEPKLEAFREILTNRQAVKQSGNSLANVAKYQKLAYELYQQLIEPIVPRRDKNQSLLIVPDGPLALLPFDLLVASETDTNAHFRTLDYLLQRHNLYYAYSATLLIDQPEKAEAEQYYAGFAPSYGETDLYAEASDFSPLDSGVRGGFSPLLYNQQEVKNIAKQFSGSYWTGAEASEARFKMSAEKYRILHLAMHAFTNDDSPNLSGLVFSPASPNATNETEDGILHTYEIYDLDLKADLAVLSACNTGIGKIQRGEGVMSLARAFTYAGCPSLLMSLWQADDEATREIMRIFFDKMDEGYTKSEALRLAKLDFLGQTDLAHPHYWGAFLVIGKNTPLQGVKYWPWLLGLGAALLTGLLAYPRLKKAA